MFDTDRVGSVTVTPLHGAVTWKACAACKAQTMTGAVTLTPKAGLRASFTGEVRVETDTRRKASAAAAWRVDEERDGLRVRVTLPSEQYVAAVLSAEAAADEPPASLRAMAVVVRSFAMAFQGELTDSTSTQVLRLGAFSAAVRDAVRETSGETLWFRGKQVPGYFGGSSGGYTESAFAAWGVNKGWLPAQMDAASERSPSQWHTEIGLAELGALLAKQGFGKGPVRTIAVVKKTGSGRVARIRVDETEIKGATFRFAVGRALGWNRLRSDLYTVRVVGAAAVFEGKGYGHGVGLSQAGAKVMAKEGRDTGSILRFYFPGAEARVTPKDSGWVGQDGVGWRLVSTSVDPGLVVVGDAAWKKACGLMHPARVVKPEVRVFPTVALFRGVTGEAGWTLAATRGDRVYLQPAALRGHPEDVLLHEMLHVLVESDARADVPLWFREGLVEALAEPAGPSDGGMRDVDAKLTRPGSLAEAQEAHRAAGALVRRLGKIYSRDVMVGWLRTGVPGEALGRAGIR